MLSGRTILSFVRDSEMFPRTKWSSALESREIWKSSYRCFTHISLSTLRNRPECIDLFNGEISKCVRKRDHDFIQKTDVAFDYVKLVCYLKDAFQILSFYRIIIGFFHSQKSYLKGILQFWVKILLLVEDSRYIKNLFIIFSGFVRKWHIEVAEK